jgi:UDP-N-acetylmuramoylalanine--D-glutamate ligase
MPNILDELKNKKIHIVGITGAEGSAIAAFLISLKFKKIYGHDFCEEKDFKNSFFSFHDGLKTSEKEKAFRKIKRSNIKIYFKDKYLKRIEHADVIFIPQSWFRYSFNKPLKNLPKNIKFYNITKLYFNLCKAPICAVTGTSGKSTTTRLIYEIFKKSLKKTYFSGNDRENIQILENILDVNREDALILEVSNRQLKTDLKKSPHIGVITNISPNHMDDHKNFADYAKVKKSLLKYQTNNDFAVLNYENQLTREIASQIKSKTFFFSSKRELDEGAYLKGAEIVIRKDGSEYKICSIHDLKIPGEHNIENVLAASAAAFLAGINTKTIRNAIIKFRGLKSRIEFVRELFGVKYFEDSSACNPDGSRVAIKSFREPVILIAGGERKKPVPGEFEEMARAIVTNRVRVLLLIGKKAELIKKKVKEKIVEYNTKDPIVQICPDLSFAVKTAYKSAKKGDVVILSPGCESFDMFRDYRDRARKFKRLVRALPY